MIEVGKCYCFFFIIFFSLNALKKKKKTFFKGQALWCRGQAKILIPPSHSEGAAAAALTNQDILNSEGWQQDIFS